MDLETAVRIPVVRELAEAYVTALEGHRTDDEQGADYALYRDALEATA